jgi:hypothetical protein
MAWIHPAAEEYQRRRWTRHDAHRWLKPDPEHWLSPEELRLEYPELYERKYGAAPQAPSSSALDVIRNDESLRLRAIAIIRDAQAEIAMLRHELALRRKFRPDQPRVPAGNPDGGQWTSEDGSAARVRLAQTNRVLTDAYGERYYNPGGHHEMPRGVYEKWNLRPETRRVFDQGTTGTIPEVGFRTSPSGPATRHAWGGEGGMHQNYNKAVQELSDRFLQTNGITPEQMTPDQARTLLKEIRESEDPRIRDYNSNLRRIRRLFRLRSGSD